MTDYTLKAETGHIGSGERNRVVVTSRSIGQINILTRETREQLLSKLFPNSEPLVHVAGLNDMGEPADHYINLSKEGDIALLIVTHYVERKVAGVIATGTRPQPGGN